ncbi:MAG: hypothetical protein ACLFR2_03730 [Candidatus Kapaibacterium sp.]
MKNLLHYSLLLSLLLAQSVLSQSFIVFNVNPEINPVMKANFFAFDAQCSQMMNLTP